MIRVTIIRRDIDLFELTESIVAVVTLIGLTGMFWETIIPNNQYGSSPYFIRYDRVVSLTAIAGILSWYLLDLVKSLQLVWRWGTRR